MSFFIVNWCTLLSLSYINDCGILLHFLGSSLFYRINHKENLVKTSLFCDVHEIRLYPLSGYSLGIDHSSCSLPCSWVIWQPKCHFWGGGGSDWERLELNMSLIFMEEESGRDLSRVKPFLRHAVEMELNYLRSHNSVWSYKMQLACLQHLCGSWCCFYQDTKDKISHNWGLLTGDCKKMLHSNHLLLSSACGLLAVLGSSGVSHSCFPKVRPFIQAKLCSGGVGSRKTAMGSLQHMSNLLLQQCSWRQQAARKGQQQWAAVSFAV